MGDLAADAELAAALVHEAGLLAHRMRADGLAAEHKTSVSDIVTQADTAAERLIVQQLAAERPDDAIVGEEGTVTAGHVGPHLGDRPRRRHLQLLARQRLVVQRDRPPRRGRRAARRGAPRRVPAHLGRRPRPAQHLRRYAARAAARDRTRGAVRGHLPAPAVLRQRGGRGLRPRARARSARCGCWARGPWTAWRSPPGQWDVLFQHSVADWDRLPGAAGAHGGGAAGRNDGGRRRWSVAGAPTAGGPCRARGVHNPPSGGHRLHPSSRGGGGGRRRRWCCPRPEGGCVLYARSTTIKGYRAPAMPVSLHP